MLLHEEKIKSDNSIIVGSYRRGLESSGDIDVLIKVPDSYTKKESKEYLEALIKKYNTYIVEILALGEKKCMAIVKLNKDSKARRLDLLITPEKEYAYAILYFTGSDSFNVAFRSYALSKGYTLNEHIMKPIDDANEVPHMETEKNIFDFLSLEYKEPNQRINDSSIVEKKKLTLKNLINLKRKKKTNKNKSTK